MEFELKPGSANNDNRTGEESPPDSSYSLSANPVVRRHSGSAGAPELPRSYGTDTLCLMARDPRTLFAYWDIDWPAALREQSPKQREVILRVLDPTEAELVSVEIEPLAGNSYVAVPAADAAYRGEIGYFNPPANWNCLASSEVVRTPADAMDLGDEADFATIPFHLSFQHMIDLLRNSKQENESLTSMLNELRASAKAGTPGLSTEQRALAEIVDQAAAQTPASPASEYWAKPRTRRTSGIGGSSPSEGFGGPDENKSTAGGLGGFGGSSRTR